MSSSRSSARPKLGVVDPPKSEMLSRLERHEITLDEYLNCAAEQAVQHLKGRVDAAQLQNVQSMIREQMTSDPAVIQYLKQATGLDLDACKGV